MIQIENFSDYFIDENGIVYSTKYGKNKIIKQQNHYKGYKLVTLVQKDLKKTLKVHRLVACAYLDNPFNKEQVNHIDGIKINNNVSNLEWTTQSENQLHAHKIGLMDDRIRKMVVRFSKPVRHNETSKIFSSLKMACAEYGLKYKSEFARMKYYNTSVFSQL
jgi:hypothetical protein